MTTGWRTYGGLPDRLEQGFLSRGPSVGNTM